MLDYRNELCKQFEQAERHGLSAVLNLYNRELAAVNNDSERLGDILSAIQDRILSIYEDEEDGILCSYLALEDSLEYYARNHLDDKQYHLFAVRADSWF